MTPVTRREIYLSRATGSGEDVPTPITREEQYLKQICDRLDNVAAPTDEQVAEAVSSYLDEHGTTEIATMAEFLEVLNNGTD